MFRKKATFTMCSFLSNCFDGRLAGTSTFINTFWNSILNELWFFFIVKEATKQSFSRHYSAFQQLICHLDTSTCPIRIYDCEKNKPLFLMDLECLSSSTRHSQFPTSFLFATVSCWKYPSFSRNIIYFYFAGILFCSV